MTMKPREMTSKDDQNGDHHNSPEEKTREEDDAIRIPLFERALNFILCRGNLEEDKIEAVPISFRELFRYATRGEMIIVFIAVIFSVIEGSLLPLVSLINGKIANIYIEVANPIGNDDFLSRVIVFAVIYFVGGVVVFIVASLECCLLRWVTSRIVERIRAEFVSAVLRQDAAWLDSTSVGALSSQLNNNIERIRDGLGDKVALISRSLTIFISATCIAIYTEWRIALIMLWTGPLCAITMGIMPRFSAGPMKQSLDVTEEANSVAEEAILNFKTVASLNAQKSIVQKYSEIIRRGLIPQLKLGFFNGFFEGFFFMQFYIFFIAGLWYGIEAYHEGVIKEAGNVFIVVNITMFSAYFLGLLGPHMTALLKARVGAAVVYRTIDRKRATSSMPGFSPLDPSTLPSDIRFESVQFGYAGRPKVLKGLTWRVSEGETVALVGRSGCGKSTSIGLLTRLFDASSGSVQLGGVGIRCYDVAKLRKMIGVVSQEPVLFNGTIRENIRLGREGIDDQAIVRAATLANAHDFIMSHPKGYDTLLGAGGVSLSGGQKQRIAIARAVATEPRILLLDEATSALDSHSERIVQDALMRAAAGRTTVVVAHRLASIRNVTRIFVIEDGQVAEEGSYNELCAKEDGKFAAMVALQRIEEKTKADSEGDWNEKVDEDSNGFPIGNARTKSEWECLPPFSVGGVVGNRVAPADRSAPTRQISWRSSGRQETVRKGEMARTGTKSSMLEMPSSTSATNSESFGEENGGLLRMISFSRWRYFCLVAAACFRGFELPAISVMQVFVFHSLWKKDYESILFWTLFAEFMSGILTWLALINARTIAAWLSERVLLGVRVRSLSSLLHRPAAYFDRSSSSPASSAVALSQHAGAAAAPVDYRASLVFENAFSSFVLTIVCFVVCWPNGLTCVFFAVVFTAFFIILNYFLQKVSKRIEMLNTTSELALEMMENTRTIQLLGVEYFFIHRFQSLQQQVSLLDFQACILRGALHGLSQAFIYFVDAAATAVGVYAVYHRVVNVDALYLSEVCVSCMGYSVMMMSTSFNDLLGASSSARQLFRLFDPNEEDMTKGEKPSLSGEVSVSRVVFSYPSRPQHLASNGLSLSVPAGSSLALVGPSGGGKSTLVSLLERFYQPSSGNIEMDGVSLFSISKYHLRHSIALVGQEPVLFRGTIIDNLRLGVEEAVSMEDIREACRVADAESFILALPLGYDTTVGDGAKQLSGGQRQRLALARAILRKPRLLLLDEATAALDSYSEQSVRKALEATSKERTTISIAHRLASIEHFDKICFIDGGRLQIHFDLKGILGRVVECGSHSELLRKQGKYAALAEQQKLS